MTNIAEILKDCPKGTELYSPICGVCRLREVEITSNFTVIHCIGEKNCDISFDECGRFEYDGGECLLFPSKENRDWSIFNNTKRFKKGDFIYNGGFICIYNGITEHGSIEFFACIPWYWNGRDASAEYMGTYDVCPTGKSEIGVGFINAETRLATEDEKNLLLSAIEYEGYVWDSEKLELRKKEIDFKPFDNVLVRDDTDDI